MPAPLKPLIAAEQEYSAEVSVMVAKLPRIRAIAMRDDTEIQAQWGFRVGQHGFPLLSGVLSGQVQLRCERCLQPVMYSIKDRFELLLMESSQTVSAEWMQNFEVVEYDGVIDIGSLLEDQILLALPLVVKHENMNDCDPAVRQWMQDKAEFDKQLNKPNPFAILKNLDP